MQLKEQNMNTQFLNDGFIKLSHFLNEAQLNELQDLYQSSNIAQPENKMYSNFHELNFEKNQHIENEIIRICMPSIERQMKDFKIVGAAFILKGTGKDSDSRLHQDWRIVDESKYASAIVWIPLMDVDENNGCLQVLPESHKWFDSIRSATVSSVFLKFDIKINPYLKAVPLKRSECAVFASKVFHGSKPNLSNNIRTAITITIIPKDARYIDYFQDRENHVKILDCNDKTAFQNSFKTYNGISAEQLTVIDELADISPYIISEKQLLEKIYQEKGSPSLTCRIKHFAQSIFS